MSVDRTDRKQKWLWSRGFSLLWSFFFPPRPDRHGLSFYGYRSFPLLLLPGILKDHPGFNPSLFVSCPRETDQFLGQQATLLDGCRRTPTLQTVSSEVLHYLETGKRSIVHPRSHWYRSLSSKVFLTVTNEKDCHVYPPLSHSTTELYSSLKWISFISSFL